MAHFIIFVNRNNKERYIINRLNCSVLDKTKLKGAAINLVAL
jgi:hypothetical protein